MIHVKFNNVVIIETQV